jgi:hypothetical protein
MLFGLQRHNRTGGRAAMTEETHDSGGGCFLV